jgi:hypothetical protein
VELAVIVTGVPTVEGEDGDMPAVTDVQPPNVKWSACVIGLVPLAVVTVTSTVPFAWLGLTAVMVVSLTTLKPVAATPPNFTAATPLPKPVPLIVTAVPPVVVPTFGVTLVTEAMKEPTVNDHV